MIRALWRERFCEKPELSSARQDVGPQKAERRRDDPAEFSGRPERQDLAIRVMEEHLALKDEALLYGIIQLQNKIKRTNTIAR